ncbi:TPA: neuraminidase-like domain-containing protein, partial [Morganella morganii]
AGAVLDALQSNTLSTALLAGALNLSEYVITQALTQAGQSTSLTSWKQLAALPSRLDLADNLLITPKDITNLLTVSDNSAPSYTDLTTLAGLLQAGLNEQQTTQLQNQSEPRRSEALSGEYRSLVMGKPLAGRDDIWRKLLIDGKVSAAITTTRLADAIAGIQLYINRTVAGDEPGADNAVLERQFFKDWDTYNKRYSTWAGVSQLVYYPENFIDPTIRIGQTGMMNTMLEQLSQSELNSDTLEDGFRQYLTAFEQVANLKVISGYHDAVDIDEGNTWFIGTSQTEPKKYYWRKADHSKCQNGRFAANAWSDWKEITCAVNPYQDMVRPVIFRSRLCLLWIEEQIQKDVKDSEKSAPAYILKLSHIKYDGGWASPFSYNVTNDFVTMKEGRKGLYCAENPGKSALTVACYLVKDSDKVSQKESEQGDNNKGQEKTEYFGRYIFSDMSVENTPDIRNILRYTAPQLDTTTITRVNSLLLHSYSSTLTPENQTGTSNADIELNTQNYYLSQTEDKTYLVFGTDVNVYIHTDFVPLLLRPQFIENMPANAGVYRTEGTVYTPRNDCPGGECTFSVIKHRHDNSNTIYLSIPGDNKTLQYVNKINLFASNTHGTDVLGQCIHQGSDKDRHYFTCNTRNSISDYPADETYFTLSVVNSSIKKLGEIRYSKIKEYLAYTHLYRCSLEYSHSNETIGKSTALDLIYLYDNDAFGVAYGIGENKLDITRLIKNNELNLILKTKYNNGEIDISRNYKLNITVPGTALNAISLYTDKNGAQYMEWDAYRTRLNTLFARQLIERANRGIEAVLSPETQNLREPKPGQGTYVTLTLKPYDP